MTISTTTSRISYSGNGVTTVFPVPYKFLASGDLVVLEVNNTTGVETTKTLTTHYTVSGAGGEAGGTLTMLTAPASGTTLVIYREMSFTQETGYPTGGDFPEAAHEAALDKLTMLVHQNLPSEAKLVQMSNGTVTGFDPQLPNVNTAGVNAFPRLNAGKTGFEWATAGTLSGTGIELTSFTERYSEVTISSGAVTFNLDNANVFLVTLTENITSITFSNVTSATVMPITIEFTQDATGGRTVTGWPAGVKWSGGSAPTITATAAAVDVIAGYTRDGGTTIRLDRAMENSS